MMTGNSSSTLLALFACGIILYMIAIATSFVVRFLAENNKKLLTTIENAKEDGRAPFLVEHFEQSLQAQHRLKSGMYFVLAFTLSAAILILSLVSVPSALLIALLPIANAYPNIKRDIQALSGRIKQWANEGWY